LADPIRRLIALAALMFLIVGGAAVIGFPDARAQGPATGSVPGFVQANKKYAIRWQPGDTEVYTVLEIRDGWARGRRDEGDAKREGAGQPVEQWLNINRAITITEAR
jgi:hypothetical protein